VSLEVAEGRGLLSYVVRSIRARGIRSLLLVLGVLLVSVSFGLLLSTVETVQVTVDGDLAEYWRTTYDILVRPPGSRSAIEEKYGLVQANHLSGIFGGITYEQYEAIKRIPGVEIAAPIAMLSYLNLDIPFGIERPVSLNESGFYHVEVSLLVDDGLSTHQRLLREYLLCLPQEAVPEEEILSDFNKLGWQIVPCPSSQDGGAWVPLHYTIPALLAAVDPNREAELIGLDKAVTIRQYFENEIVGEYLPPRSLYSINVDGLIARPYVIPILMNIHSYVSAEIDAKVFRYNLIANDETIQEVLGLGGEQYLEGFPSTQVGATTYTNEEIYKWIPHWESRPLNAWTEDTGFRGLFYAPLFNTVMPTSPAYSEIQVEWTVSPPVLEARPIGILAENDWRFEQTPEIKFRETITSNLENAEDDVPLLVNGMIVGGFDIERLPSQDEELTYVPLETYYPPSVTLRYEESGSPLEQPIKIQPTLNPLGYIQRPPMLLTTLESARLFNPVDPISAIRIRVGGIDRYSPEAQERIEAIAGEIVDATGLDVDVVAGSSPRTVLVHLPGYGEIAPMGYVEEQWIQKGVNLSIGQQVKRVNVLLFGAMLSVGGLFILNTYLTSALSRQREISLQKALGWRSSTVVLGCVTETALIGCLTGILAILLTIALQTVFRMGIVTPRVVLILPVAVGLCLAGGLIPAWISSRVAPARGTRQGEVSGGGAIFHGPTSLLCYALRSMARRRIRMLVVGGTMSMAAALLTIFLAGTLGLRGYLAGTLLGDYIILHVQSYHYLMAVVCLLVGGIATMDALLVSAIERRQEIGILKALGWRDSAVFQLFLIEGVVLGAVGALVGIAVSLATTLSLQENPTGHHLAIILAIGLLVPTIIGGLSALMPARMAASFSAAEALRHE